MTFLISCSSGYDRNIHTTNLINTFIAYFWEHKLFSKAKCKIPMPIKVLWTNTLEITDTRKSKVYSWHGFIGIGKFEPVWAVIGNF